MVVVAVEEVVLVFDLVQVLVVLVEVGVGADSGAIVVVKAGITSLET